MIRRPSLFQPKEPIPPRAFWLIAGSSFVLLFAAWSLLTYTGWVRPLFLPTPTMVLGSLWGMARGRMWTDIGASCYRIGMGFLLSAVLAVPIGLLMGTFKAVEAFIEPINDFIRYMPVVSFIPLCILWVGIGDELKILIIFIGTFFQMLVLVAQEVNKVPVEFLEMTYTLGATKLQVLWRVIVPASLPGIFDTMRVCLGWAWSYVVVAEIVAASSGLGFMIMQASRFLKTADIFSGIMVIGVLGILSDFLLKRAYEFLFPWSPRK